MPTKLEKLFEDIDKIETPTLDDLFHGRVSLWYYLSELPTKFGEYFYGLLPK